MNVIFIAAILPLFVEVTLWLIFYIRFNSAKLLPLAKTFKMLADEAERTADCRKDNISLLEDLLDVNTPPSFMKNWEYMKYQIENIYSGEFIPEGKIFFPFDILVEIEGGRDTAKLLWRSFWIFEILALSLPVLTALMVYDPSKVMDGAASGLCAFSLIAAGQLFFTLADQSAFHKVQKEYNRFISGFNNIIPVADKQTALVVEAVKKNQDAFEEGVDKIIDKFDGFAEITVLPALKESLKNISDMQENGMKILSSNFAQHLTRTLDVRMVLLSKTIGGIQTDLTKLNESIAENISGLNQLLVSQRTVLEEAVQKLILSEENQIEATAQAQELIKQSFVSSERLTEQMGKMSDAVEQLTSQNSMFSLNAANMIEQTNQTQMKINTQLKSSQDKIESAVSSTTELMNNIVQKMKDAMAAAGKEIALGIKESTGDNAEMIEKLAQQAKNLREDYDTYFNRLETHTKSTYEDMDYHVQNIIAKITQEVQKILTDNMKTSQSVLEDYKESTTNLLLAFKDQTSSISLYAKEIDLDVNELSENLKTSVTAFNQSLQSSVESTIQEFDSGLAQLSLRIANTVESICDAVEALPSALQKK